MFYLCINGGSLLSTIITPILRGRYEWNAFMMSSITICDSPSVSVMMAAVCLHLQLRNVASTVSRNVILWPLVSLQHSWWSLLVRRHNTCIRNMQMFDMLCIIGNNVLPVMYLTVVFIVGSPMYYKAEPQGNIMLDVCKCIGVSLVRAFCSPSMHWCVMTVAREVCKKLVFFFFCFGQSVCH